MASEKPERKNRKRKPAANSVSRLKKSSAKPAGKGRKEGPEPKEEKIMADENPTTTGGETIPPEAEEKVRSSSEHVRRAADDARRAAEDLRSAAGAVAEEYRGRAGEVWQDASERVRSFQDDAEQYVRDNPTKAIFTALGVGFVLGLIFRR
jgi:ElaB/YqjD/DUF883 family membrane-anchored ribosome-binding protein